MRHQTNERSFQLPHVRADVGSDVQSNIGWQRDFLLLGFLLQNGDLGFKVGRLDIGNESPLEAAAETVFDFGQFFWRTVTGDYDLLHRFVQSVKCMEELFLGPFLLCQKLDIVDQQYVYIAELVAEGRHLVIAQRVDHFIGKLLAGDIADGRLRRPPLYFMPDSLHQMGFPHADAPIKKERVVGF